MIIKDYFADGLLQIAIVLSLLRSDLDSFLDTSVHPLPVRSHLVETNAGPLSGITRTDLRFRSRGLVREYPKLLDDGYSDRFSSVLRDLHSLSSYRRFDGISTSFHTWLVDDGRDQVELSSGNPLHTADDTHEASGISPDDNSASRVEEIWDVGSDPHSLERFLEVELSKEDMELINILYLQDIDLGIGREVFDSFGADAQVDAVDPAAELKELDINQTFFVEEDRWQHDFANTPTAQNVNDLNYVIDTETGEQVLISSSHVGESPDRGFVRRTSTANVQIESPLGNEVLTTGVADLRLVDQQQNDPLYHTYSHTQSTELQELQQEPGVSYNRLSSYEQRWDDMISILDLQSVLEEGGAASDGGLMAANTDDWEHFNSASFTPQYDDNALSGLVQNVSMTQPVGSLPILLPTEFASVSSATPYDWDSAMDNESFPISFHPNSFSNSSLSIDVGLPANMSVEPSLDLSSIDNMNDNYSFMFDIFRDMVPSYSAIQGVYGFNSSSSVGSTASSFSPSTSITVPHQIGTAVAAEGDPIETDSMPNSATIEHTNALFQELLHSDILSDGLLFDDETFMDHDDAVENNWSTDSAVSSMNSPTLQSPMDQPNGATGFSDDAFTKHAAYSDKYDVTEEFDYERSALYPREHSTRTNSSSNSSYFDGQSDLSADHYKHVAHNHTYPLTPGQLSRSELEEAARREKEERATRCRDEKKAKAMQIPLTMEEMIDTSVEHFNELLSRHKLTDAQNQLIRDIRRRGKNKQAAQNCRKRKLEVIQTVEDELAELRRHRDNLLREKSQLGKQSASLKEKYGSLEAELFRRLHDETGQEYDPRTFAVLQTDDGRIFVVPRDTSNTEQSHDEKNNCKRKPKKKKVPTATLR